MKFVIRFILTYLKITLFLIMFALYVYAFGYFWGGGGYALSGLLVFIGLLAWFIMDDAR